jgi:multiple sugar transport system permease protein
MHPLHRKLDRKRGSASFSSKSLPYLLLLPSFLYLTVVTIFPLIYGIYLSLTRFMLYEGSPSGFVGLANYIDILTSSRFWNSVIVTATFVAFAGGLELLLGLGLALLCNRRLRGISMIRTLLIAPMAIPPVVVGLTWRLMYQQEIGVIGYFLELVGLPSFPFLGSPSTALYAVAIADIWEWTPFMFLILYAGLLGISPELYESATVDGANASQVFRWITLPLLMPSLSIAVLLRAIDLLKVFDIIYVTVKGGPGTATETLNYMVYLLSYKSLDMGAGNALAFVLLLVTIVLSTVFIRRFYARR